MKLDVKRSVSFENSISRAASGRETGVSWRELPIITFELVWDFLDANQATTALPGDGSASYPEFDKLLGFFEERHGDLMPFYLRLADLTRTPADSEVYGQQIGTGDGVSTNFQLCRSVGSYLEAVQTPDPSCTPTIYLDGEEVTTGVSILDGGIVQFTEAPDDGAAVTADFRWLYLCRFDASDADFDQVAYLLHECQSLKLRTVIQ